MPFVQLPPLPPWATVLLILWLQIPVVRAFPPSARCAALPLALSLQLTAVRAFPPSARCAALPLALSLQLTAVRAFPPSARCAALYSLQLTAVRAFPPSARCAALYSLQLTAAFPSSSISTTFRYPGLTLGEGLSNMHTLERLETIGDGSYFRIRHVGTPMRYGEYVTVGVKCAVRGQNHTLLVLSRPDQAHTASLLCLRDNVQRAAFTLRASRLQPSGHALLLDTTFFEDKRVLHRDLRPVMRFLAFYGDRAARSFEPHPNLAWYRRMVLGLPPPPAV